MSPHGPAVFVHGNPETSAVWGPLLSRLERADVICLSPPGFGAPLPARFEITVRGYRDWLIDRLEAFAHPVDLVGHDWGGAHAFAAVMGRPDLVRSWVSDALGVFDPAYTWHPRAQVWQTPGDGEQWVDNFTQAPLAERVDTVRALGIPGPVAERLAAGSDSDMGRAILALYRSAAQPVMADAGRNAAAAADRPGLAISATDDVTTGTPAMRQAVAARAGARLAVLDGVGHWWMTQDPDRAAQTLGEFWSRLRP